MRISQIKALYEEMQVPGRKELCPRVGWYKLKVIYKDKCYGKDAVMAKAHWKVIVEDEYLDDFIVDVQLESFMKQLIVTHPRLNVEDLTGSEIHVIDAEYLPLTKTFELEFKLVTSPLKIAMSKLLKSKSKLTDVMSLEALGVQDEDFGLHDVDALEE